MSLLPDGLGMPVLLFISFFLAVTAILWLLLPFLIFGIKAKLDEQLRVLRSLDRHLEQLHIELKASQRQRVSPRAVEPLEQMTQESRPNEQEAGKAAGDAEAAAVPERTNDEILDRWKKP